jgi:hypothetical protein
VIGHVGGETALAPASEPRYDSSESAAARSAAARPSFQELERTRRAARRQDWYGVEILETLFQLRSRIRKRELESARNLPQFRVMVVCAELFEDYREDVRSKLLQAGCSKVRRAPALGRLGCGVTTSCWATRLRTAARPGSGACVVAHQAGGATAVKTGCAEARAQAARYVRRRGRRRGGGG